MLKFNDIVRYICATVLYLYKYMKNLLKMDSVYDCARPFMLVTGILGIGGSKLCEIDGVRSVRNTRVSLIMAALITLVMTPTIFIYYFDRLFLSGEQRPILGNTALIMLVGKFTFTISTMALTCIQTHVYFKNLAKVLQILNNTDMMLRQENIQVNYWKIILKTVLFGLISCAYMDLYVSVYILSLHHSLALSVMYIIKLLMDIASEIYFLWLILLLLIIHERFVGLNKLLLQNAQVPSIMQDDSLLRRISLARDMHEQLSEAIAFFSDSCRFIIIGVLVPGMLQSLLNAISISSHWHEVILTVEEGNDFIGFVLMNLYLVIYPIMKTLTLIAVCEGHKNNRQVLTARLRYLISREEDPGTVHQLRQYIWFNYDTPPGLVDFQLADIDFTLLFMIIDIIVSYVFVIYSYFRHLIYQ